MINSFTPLSVSRIHKPYGEKNYYERNYSKDQLNASVYNPKIDWLDYKSYSCLFNKTGSVGVNKRDHYRGIYSNHPIDKEIKMLTPTVHVIRDLKTNSNFEISRVDTTSTDWAMKDRSHSTNIKLTETSTTATKPDIKYISDVNVSNIVKESWDNCLR